jgi:predicted ribosome quality control (RQC) complex YloA/Tae2 family protein
MAVDGLVVRAVVHELQVCAGGRINKIYQPTEHDVVMHIRARGQNVRLLLSANPTYPRVHLTNRTFQNPTEAPMFCMLLRKHCEGAVIDTVEQVGNDRIIRLNVRQRDELGDLSGKALIVEIMGRHSNIILLDASSGAIIDGIRHVTPAISSYRVVMPGHVYTAPPDQGKADPLCATKRQFAALMEGDAADSPDVASVASAAAEWLVRRFSGLSPLVAREIVHRSGIAQQGAAEGTGERNAAEPTEALWNAFASVMEPVARHEYRPAVVTAPGGKNYFSVVELTHLRGDSIRFPSVSECLESYFGNKAEQDWVRQRTADLVRLLQNEKNKNVKKLEKLYEAIEEAKDADKYRIIGELLTASLHLVNKGDDKAEIVNYYDELQRPIIVELDPQLSPSENAQRYFKKYAKLKNSIAAVQEQIESARGEIAYLDTLLQQLADAGPGDIEEIREELIEQGYIRHRQTKAHKPKKKDRPLLACYTSSEGIPVYVGKNNTQNEYLTNRLAKPGDTWLHTKDIPGSHVVIRSERFGDKTLEEAAQLAAYFSQARESSNVPVDYTLIKYVRKPAGAKPGFVIYDHQKTLFVTPDEKRISQLKMEMRN